MSEFRVSSFEFRLVVVVVVVVVLFVSRHLTKEEPSWKQLGCRNAGLNLRSVVSYLEQMTLSVHSQ